MRNLIYSANFLANFGTKMGVATTRPPNGLGPPNPTKKLAHWMELLGQLLSRNPVFEIFRGEPPLKGGGGGVFMKIFIKWTFWLFLIEGTDIYQMLFVP